jgi:hypothetical protein
MTGLCMRHPSWPETEGWLGWERCRIAITKPNMKNKNAVAMGAIKSGKKAMAARINGAKGGRPKKP